MDAKVIFKSCASATIEIQNDNPYYTGFNYDVFLNGEEVHHQINTNVFSIYNLTSNTTYELSFSKGIENVTFTTDTVSYVLNVKDFGAKGDGVNDDTLAIQSAIFACPKNGMVVVPRGE